MLFWLLFASVEISAERIIETDPIKSAPLHDDCTMPAFKSVYMENGDIHEFETVRIRVDEIKIRQSVSITLRTHKDYYDLTIPHGSTQRYSFCNYEVDIEYQEVPGPKGRRYQRLTVSAI